MTTSAAPRGRVGPSGGLVRVLEPTDEPALRQLLAADAAVSCFPEARLDAGGLRAGAPGGAFWGYCEGPAVRSALLVGANLVPVATTDAARAAFAAHAIRQGRRSSSIVGPADEVLDLWRRLEPVWGPAREVRAEQHLMVADQPPRVTPDALVTVRTPGDLDALLPACVAMFTEEVGVSPVAGGMAGPYRRRIADLLADGRSLARFDADGPLFKAEIGALSRRAAQIQGVWVRPDHRGLGLAASAMAAVAALSAERAPVTSLYVNAFNVAARRSYETAGFSVVGRFATVLF